MSETGKVATANRLSDGAVVFLAEAGRWCEGIDSALVAVETAALTEEATQAEAVNHVTGSYLIDVEHRDGRVRPLHIRERIRAQGPTVGTDLNISGSLVAPGLKEARHVSL